MGWGSFFRSVAPIAAVVTTVVAPELLPEIGTALGATAGSAEATAAGAAVVSGGTTLAAGGTPQQAAKSAIAAGVGSELTSTLTPEVQSATGASPETSKAVATGLGTSGGALATGSNLKDAATKGLIAGSVQGAFGSPAEDASTTDKLINAFEKQYATQALGNLFSPKPSTTSSTYSGSPIGGTSVTTTGAGTSPGSAALAQALRTDLGAPIFGGDKEKGGKQSGWNVESLRYMGGTGEA